MDTAELLAYIARHREWVYGLMFAYAFAKTGPLPLIAGFVAASGVLQPGLLILALIAGTLLGSELRFRIGRWGSAWIYERWPAVASWLALASASVDRFAWPMLLLYRFVKGAFSPVSVGAGGSAMPWYRFAMINTLSAAIWACTLVAAGWQLAQLGLKVQREWAVYGSLALLVTFIVLSALLAKRLKRHLQPYAEAALDARMKAQKKNQNNA
jgi:membrane-associated protein